MLTFSGIHSRFFRSEIFYQNLTNTPQHGVNQIPISHNQDQHLKFNTLNLCSIIWVHISLKVSPQFNPQAKSQTAVNP